MRRHHEEEIVAAAREIDAHGFALQHLGGHAIDAHLRDRHFARDIEIDHGQRSADAHLDAGDDVEREIGRDGGVDAVILQLARRGRTGFGSLREEREGKLVQVSK